MPYLPFNKNLGYQSSLNVFHPSGYSRFFNPKYFAASINRTEDDQEIKSHASKMAPISTQNGNAPQNGQEKMYEVEQILLGDPRKSPSELQ